MAVLTLVAAATPVVGCGSGSDNEKGGVPEREAEGEQGEQAQAEALGHIPETDRTAFIQLATAVGTLRARAAPVIVGTSDRLASARPLVAAQSTVSGLEPSDPQLVALRRRLLPVLTRFIKAPIEDGRARHAALAANATADQIEAGLRHYSQRSPAIGGLIPD